MAGINTGKVITGGVAAGVVFNIADFLWNFILGPDYAANATRLNLDPALLTSSAVMFAWVAIDLLMGLLVVFIYAAIRPRFGPGPRTASIAGLIIFIPVSLVILGFTHMGYFTLHMFLKAEVCQLIGTLVGANVGAYLYKEA